jgi:hypothetical protein
LGGCASDPLAMNHNAKPSHTDRRRHRRTVGIACPAAKRGHFETAGISGPALPTAILPIVTTGVPHDAFDLGSMDSNVFQRSVVECLQHRDLDPYLPLVPQPGPEPDYRRRDPCAPTRRLGLRFC